MKFLPSKKFVFIFVLILIVVALFLVFSGNDTPNENNGKNQNKVAVSEVSIKDSDNDGLVDWEEALWKTDINNSDSDGDGTPDGQEIEEGRDPSVAGPDDKLENSIKSSVLNKNISSFDQLSKTDEFTKSFITQYLLQKSLNDGNLSEDAKEAIIESVLGDTSLKMTFNTYEKSDIRTASFENTSTIRTYGNQMGKILKENNPNIDIDNILSMLQLALDSGDKKQLSDLENIIEKYTKILDDSIKVSVPKSALDIHLDFLNGTRGLLELIIGMYRVFDDPLSGLVGIGNFQNILTNLEKINKSIKKYFENSGNTYTFHEDGYKFINVFE